MDEYESSGGAEGNTLRQTGLPIIVMTTVGHRTGKVRKLPVMRVEHDGEYAIVGLEGRRAEAPRLVPQPRRRSERHGAGRA